jgi:predicted ribosomally synthesized peptide with nif11-like leader
MDINKMDISPELRAKAAACKTPDELLALVKSEGYKLSEAELESIAGGKKNSWGLYCSEDICPSL